MATATKTKNTKNTRKPLGSVVDRKVKVGGKKLPSFRSTGLTAGKLGDTLIEQGIVEINMTVAIAALMEDQAQAFRAAGQSLAAAEVPGLEAHYLEMQRINWHGWARNDNARPGVNTYTGTNDAGDTLLVVYTDEMKSVIKAELAA